MRDSTRGTMSTRLVKRSCSTFSPSLGAFLEEEEEEEGRGAGGGGCLSGRLERRRWGCGFSGIGGGGGGGAGV